MDWLECMEREFFIDHLDKLLIEFLGKQGILNGGNDPEKWERLFRNARKWRTEYMRNSELLYMSSYFAWNIHITLAEFLFPHSSDTAEMMKKIFLAGWLLKIDGDDYETECYRRGDFDFEFECSFEYPKEKCTRLSKDKLVGELREIYDRSYNELRSYKKRQGNNPEYIAWVEPSYPAMLRFIERLESFEDLQAVRLNEFDFCDKYVWYITKNSTSIYFVEISDFA